MARSISNTWQHRNVAAVANGWRPLWSDYPSGESKSRPPAPIAMCLAIELTGQWHQHVTVAIIVLYQKALYLLVCLVKTIGASHISSFSNVPALQFFVNITERSDVLLLLPFIFRGSRHLLNWMKSSFFHA